MKQWLVDKFDGETVSEEDAFGYARQLAAFGVILVTSAVMYPASRYFWGLPVGWTALTLSTIALIAAAIVYYFVHWLWTGYESCISLRSAKRFPLLKSQIICYLIAMLFWTIWIAAVPQLKLAPGAFLSIAFLGLALAFGGFKLLVAINARILSFR